MKNGSFSPTDGIPGIAATDEMIRNAELELDLTHNALFQDTLLSLTDGSETAFGLPAVAPGVCFLKADGTWLRPLRPPLDTISDLSGALDVVLRDAPAGLLGVVVRGSGSDDPASDKVWRRFDLCARGYRRVAIHAVTCVERTDWLRFEVEAPILNPSGEMDPWVPPELRTTSPSNRCFEERLFSPLFGEPAPMADKLSAKARARLAALKEVRRKWGHAHSLVERVVSAKQGHHHLISQISRASQDVGLILVENGFLGLAENANEIAALINRGGPIERKFTRMRELVGTVRNGLERAEKVTKERG